MEARSLSISTNRTSLSIMDEAAHKSTMHSRFKHFDIGNMNRMAGRERTVRSALTPFLGKEWQAEEEDKVVPYFIPSE
ncbi:hypothetical protein L484_021063 [Morus notabilis]|uniref:Uncharacterized protein n=1 Tax=Morus notabilis TaxID=981085 RepID=W9RPT4_9ROSA|nr:hypothetical protein L484_021063 [Morus notabilis]